MHVTVKYLSIRLLIKLVLYSYFAEREFMKYRAESIGSTFTPIPA